MIIIISGEGIHPFVKELGDSHADHMLAMTPHSAYVRNRENFSLTRSGQ